MKFAILHLSDIHLKKKNNPILEKKVKINNAIKSELYGVENVFIVVSGDIAFSGQEDEYEVATELFDSIKEQLKVLEKECKFIFVPGNHDCNFKNNNSVRDMILESITRSTIDTDIIEQMCVPQHNYFEFVEMYEDNSNIEFKDKLYKKFKFNLNGYEIVFNCFNSSWMSSKNEIPSKLYFPYDIYEKEIIEKDNHQNITISVFHHPFHWLEPSNHRTNRDGIEKISHIVLSGHEHTHTYSERKTDENGVTNYIEGGELQSSYNSDTSNFNLLIFDINFMKYKMANYQWKQEKYIPYISNWIETTPKSNDGNSICLDDKFQEHLNNIGISLNHSQKTTLKLDDLYVYPDAKIIKFDESEEENIKHNINLEIIKKINESNMFLITGEEKSGKSSLCKMFFKHYYENGYYPVLLDGREIKKSSISDFNKVLYRCFCTQYTKESLEDFKQLEDSKKVIIIDDFDKIRINDKHAFILISSVIKYYDNIFITGNELFKFSEILQSGEVSGDILKNFNKLEIMQFGYKLRGKLINKWNSLGRLETIDGKELTARNDQYERTINTIIGNNYVPSFPFFILIMLQTQESDASINLDNSSYGYYYEHLIKQPFVDLKLKNDEIDTIYNFISELAYDFFQRNVAEKTVRDLNNFYNWYSFEYDVTFNFQKRIEELEQASIIECIGGMYKFKYNYCYYYFVARYLSNNISEIEIRNKVTKMCSTLYYEEYANIILFLTHLSKDPFILDEILNNSKNIFKEYHPTSLGRDILGLNNLITAIPEIVINNKSVETNREEAHEYRDQIEQANNEVASTTEDNNHVDYKELDIVGKLNLSFKTLEIIGQVLKNHYGSIKGNQKLILCEEAYALGLRSLQSFLTSLDRNSDSLVKEVEKIIKENGIVQNAEIEKKARRFVFNLGCAVAFHFIKKVSSSVGSKKLVETYKRILESDNSDSNSIKLIDLSIGLDFFHSIPIEDIKVLKNKTENKNHLSYNLLRALVVNHIYMFETEYKQRQKVCDLLNITLASRAKTLLSDNKK